MSLPIDRARPLMVARRYRDEYIALISALFAYGEWLTDCEVSR